jgi:4-amino-4-deoxy-L-arabinose transferase-like glycosyltransferase
VSDPSARAPFFLPVLLALVVAAAVVRAPLLTVANSSFRLTEAMNLEEAENVRISTGMMHKASLNPHAFEYPSLYYYLTLGIEQALSALGAGRWAAFVTGARALSLAFGLGTIVLVALVAQKLGGPWAGLFAASLVAFDRTAIEMSTLAKPNAAQAFFVLAGLAALVALAFRPRLRAALAAAAMFALGAASKWLGVLGLPLIALAAAATAPVPVAGGLSGLVARLRAAATRPVAPLALLAPVLLFGAVFLACVPFSLLSPREFGFGFGQVFLAQGAHRRALPFWISFEYLGQSLGWIAFALAMVGLLWAVVRLARWDGTAQANGLLVLAAWTLGYGALVLFAFARLPSYVDLLVAPLAALAGCAWVGTNGLLKAAPARAVAVALVLAAGGIANGSYAATRSHALAGDARVRAGAWLAQHAADSDRVLADQGAYVPDRVRDVHWNAWGGPDRIVYDETRTWGADAAWPAWYGGHRQLVFRNAKWTAPESALAGLSPRWVVTTSEWAHNRITPPSANDWVSKTYDLALADGSAGYVERARFTGAGAPTVVIFERAR